MAHAATPIRVFMAYSRRDADYLNEIRTALNPLERRGDIKLWYDGVIVAGQTWDEAIKENLHQADIVLLLLSNDSLASDYFYEQEVANALVRHHKGECKVVPIIVRDCLWEETQLADLQALPQDAKPIVAWTNPNAAYLSIAVGVKKIVEEIQHNPKQQYDGEAGQENIIQESKQSTQQWLKRGSVLLLCFFFAVWGVSKFIDNTLATVKSRIIPGFWGRQGGGFPPLPPIGEPDPFADQMVLVQGGTFTMGCTAEQVGNCWDWEKPIHQVTLSSFYISQYEVTQAQWRAIMGNNLNYFKGCQQCPKSESWDKIQTFLEKLNAQTGKNYCLPTEAEWEYAARGGNKSKGYKYAGSNDIDKVAWYDGNSNGKTHPVGQKQANELGLYDMSGNVYEWCGDWYRNDYYANNSANNPKGPSMGSNRVLRGGAWYFNTEHCRLSYRFFCRPYENSADIGFRLAVR